MKKYYYNLIINDTDRGAISVNDENKKAAYAQLVEHFGQENIENKTVSLKYLSSEKI